MTTDAHTIIVTDANVLINLMQVTRLDMCARLPGYEFVVPDHVREEITEPSQRSALDEAIATCHARAVVARPLQRMPFTSSILRGACNACRPIPTVAKR